MIVAALALLALPAGASANASKVEKRQAAQDCRAERTAAGAENFRTLYEKFGDCVTQAVRENRAERKQARTEAEEDCAEEELEGSELEQCESSETEQNLDEAEAEDQAELNAARACRAERDEIGEEQFAENYGTNDNKRNAFGKCVSSRAQEQEDEQTETESTQTQDDEETTQTDDGEEDDAEEDDGETESDRPSNTGKPDNDA